MVNKTKKKQVEEVLSKLIDFRELSLVDMKSKIDKYIKTHGTDCIYDIGIEYGYYDDPPFIEQVLKRKRLETDEEFEKRLYSRREIEEAQIQREKDQLKRLKEKYEG